ncbi:hypothetical protein MN116_000174 [Schistosoma mekongi]|uniref:Reverse transcriptase domain-containing protein n=1 Tax=Schistosoma mekongi TaxID=38744 RepID=A0AAE2D8Q6_SCHME|nr:hypothetical protein MN116_000174 [Schistosoma mekongi]
MTPNSFKTRVLLQDLTHHERSKLLVVSINARSLINKINYLKSIMIITKPSVVLITETWCKPTILDDTINIDNYTLFRTDRQNTSGGGTIIYTRSDLKACRFNNEQLDDTGDSTWVSIAIGHQKYLLVGCIYRPPNVDSIYDKNLSTLFFLASQQPHVSKLIGGDFNLPNIDWISPHTSQRFSKLIEMIEFSGWIQQVQIPTRGNNTLDLLFTINFNPTSVNVSSEFHNSDHKVVISTFNYQPTNNLNPNGLKKYKYRRYTNETWKHIEALIRCIRWDSYLTTGNIDTAISVFYSNLISCLDCIAPYVERVSDINSARSHIPKCLRRKLRHLRLRYYKHHDITALYNVFKIVENLDSAQLKYLLNMETTALNSINPISSMIKLFKSRLDSKSNKPPTLFITKDGIDDDPASISEQFSSYFSSCCSTEPGATANPISMMTSKCLSTVEFTSTNIKRAIATLKKSNDNGPDGIPASLMKYSGKDLPFLCLKLFNLSMDKGHYPAIWKTSFITPRFKSGSRNVIENYRPINTTSVLSRIMEKVIHKQLSSFLLSENLINPSQHGFMEKRSCATCHLKFFDYITLGRDKGFSTIVLYFDFSKAFDCVPHNLLLSKLHSHGIRNPLLSWFKSFLTGRRQIVRISSSYSKPVNVSREVVQGSVVGPLLFLPFINDVCQQFVHGKIFLFADDLKVAYLFPPTTNENTITKIIQKEIDDLSEWTKIWHLPLNVHKSGYISTGRRWNLSLHLCEVQIKPLSVVQDLGLRYTDSINFSEHVAFQASKARKSTGFIRKNFLDLHSKILLYTKCVRPILDYGCLHYSNCRRLDLMKIERIQRTFTKSLLGDYSTQTYRQRCDKLKLEPLWLRRLKLNLTLMYRLISGATYASTSQPILYTSTHNLRNKENTITIQRCRTQLRQSFITVRYATL